MIVAAFSLMLQSVAPPSATPLAGWAGTWRLDRAASRFRGEVTRIVRTRSGYLFDLGAVRFTLPDDGGFHPTIAGRETRLARIGSGRWLREHRINGRIVDRSTLTLSPDGRTLTIAGEHPGSAPEHLTKEGASIGLAGTWRSTRLGINAAETTEITIIGRGRLRWGSPADGNWYVVTVDGSPAVNEGPTSTSIATLQVSKMNDGRLRWTERLNGRASRYGIERRSADGHSLTEISWPARYPAERQVLVYRRRAP